MDQSKNSFRNIDEYIVLQPIEIRPVLEHLRQVIKTTVPEAVEVISYQMPAFKYHGMLAYFAVFKDHYSLFVGPEAVVAFKSKLSNYKLSKAGVLFPLGENFPEKLVIKMIQFCAENNIKRTELRKIKKRIK